MASDVIAQFCGTDFWDSNLSWNTDNPELTSCFEKTFLVWVPCLCLWVFSPLEVYFLVSSKTKNITWNFLNLTKLVLVLGLIFLNTVDIVESVVEAAEGVLVYAVDFWTSAIKIVTFIFVLLLIYWNKRQGLRTSGIMFLFWLLLTVAGVPQLRTEIYRLVDQKDVKLQTFTYIIHFCLVAAMLVLNLFSDSEPKFSKFEMEKKPCPELSASFVSRLTFGWFNSMAWLGYKRPLTSEDLWSMRPQDSGRHIIRRFNKYWIPVFEKFLHEKYGKTSKSENKPKRVNVVGSLIRAFLPASSMGLFTRLMGDMCSFISPFILRELIAFVSNNEPMWKGYMYAVLLLVVAEVQTILATHSMSFMYDLGLRIRTALISAIYKKALRSSASTRKGITVGQIVNLMAVDAQNFYELMPFLNITWAAPIVILFSFFLLWQAIGIAAVAGLLVMLIILPFNSFIASLVKKRQTKQMALKDERIKKMNEILNGMKVLKLYAWEPSMQDQILKIREEELKLLKSAAMLNAGTSFAWASSPFIVSFVSFGVYVLTGEDHVLNPSLAFYCLALINIMRLPIAMLPTLIQFSIIASVSLRRINKYLSNEEIDETAVSHDQSRKEALIIENGTFSWEPDENVPATLQNINLKVEQGDLVAVVGTVGSGKSSLISAFLGEIGKVSGYVNTKGRIAYVGQQAWIQNLSLRDNILFGSHYDEKKYKKVIEACALKQDFDMLPGGDITEIGEKGINLSGGQKQRVSLARAVYNDAHIYFLDDPLSAVDAHVGRHIFDNVIGPNGLLRNKTRLLVTHAITYLPQVDNIYVMKEGKILERGTYRELLAKKQEFADFLMQHLSEELKSENEMDLDIDELLGSDPTLRASFERQLSVTASNRSKQSSRSRLRRDSESSVDSTSSQLPEIVVPTRTDKLIKVEQSETGSVKFSIYGHYFVAAGLMFVILMLVFNVCAQLLTIVTNLWLSKWSSDVEMVVNGVLNYGLRDMYLRVYGAIGIVQIIAVIASSFMLVFGTISASRWLHVTILDNIFHCPMSFFDTTPTGRIVNRFSKDMDTVDTLIPMSFSGFINCFVQVLGILCVISFSTPIFAVIIIPIALLYFFIQRFYLATSRQLRRIESVSRSPIFSHFSETVSGASVIRAYGAQARFILANEEKVDENQMSLFPSQISARWLGVRLETVGNCIIFFSALFAVLNHGNMDPGIAGVSINYALQVTLVLNFCVRMTSDLETNIVAVERIKEYAQMKQEAPWYLNKKPDPSWPEKGKVEFNNYQVRYRDGLDLVLKGISFTVNGGEKIGIVGRTGAGKSSLTLCLFRILEAAGGSILIDGLDISKIGLNDLRSRLTIIPQDPVLFSGTLRLNLDPAGTYSDEALWECLALSHLSAFVKGLPKGLDYEVVEGGDNLSVGQAQLLCLARALLRKTKVLILDEATAAVDLDTDDLIQRTIRTEFKDCTVLTIAHRLNTIMDSDRVVVLDKGLLQEYDSPANLLQNKNSIFYGMAKDSGLVS